MNRYWVKSVGNIMVVATLMNLVWQCGPVAGDEVIRGKTTEVTVYRDQARVVRQIDVPAARGVQNIRLTALPAHIVVRSAFTEADAGTDVRSMRIVSKQVATYPDFKTRLEHLRATKKELLQELRSAEHNAKVIDQDLLTIEKLVNFSAEKTKQNLDRATLDVQSVTSLADFTMERRRKLANEYLQTQTEIKKLNDKIQQNDQQQEKWIAENTEETYEALLGILSPDGGTVRLVYDVGNVNWLPRYTIRSTENENSDRTFALYLDAHLVQNSGEPWDGVSLTFSTATPNRQAARPLLTPLRVQAVAPDEQHAELFTPTKSDRHVPAWMDQVILRHNAQLNSLASQRQISELRSAPEIQRKLAEDAGEDLADETYRVGKRVQISSHPQLQTISILKAELTGELQHVATPLLSSFAFREAELTNSSGQSLIAGEADVYLDGEFAGRTTLAPTTAGQQMTVGFGTDRKIRTRRELLAKEEAVQGGNRRSTLKYRLVIANYHERPIDIQLLDRLPLAAQDGSIGVELDRSSTAALSDYPLYVRMQRPTGVLRWDLEIPARRFGSDAFDFEYAYSIELDRTQKIFSDGLKQTLGDLQFQKLNMGGGMGGGGAM